jgi:hypothetical protein
MMVSDYPASRDHIREIRRYCGVWDCSQGQVIMQLEEFVQAQYVSLQLKYVYNFCYPEVGIK